MKRFLAFWGTSYVNGPAESTVGFAYFSPDLGYSTDERERIAALAIDETVELDPGHTVTRIK